MTVAEEFRDSVLPDAQGVEIENILRQAARYTAQYRGEYIFIKIGGSTLANTQTLKNIITQAILLRQNGCKVAIVHGGGPQGDAALAAAGIESRKVNGVRITDAQTLEILTAEFGRINQTLVTLINRITQEIEATHPVTAVGLAGFHGRFIEAEPPSKEYMLTGEPVKVDREFFERQFTGNCIPVIYPICFSAQLGNMNVNADSVTEALASATGAKRVIMCSDTPVRNEGGERIPTLTTEEATALIESGVVKGGMRKKVETCLKLAADPHIEGVVILNPDDRGAILRELMTDRGAGTLMRKPAAALTPVSPAPQARPAR